MNYQDFILLSKKIAVAIIILLIPLFIFVAALLLIQRILD
jgi:hypothetical protein